jgi:uncharacterized protein
MVLPRFTYHPDPLSTGSIVQTDEMCECCGEARGYKYAASMYARDRPKCVCPWCIADGGAARKFDGSFLDDQPLVQAGVPESVIDEVCFRTPGYASWQQQIWQSHCGDACEFHGDAVESEIRELDGEPLFVFLDRNGVKPELWTLIRDNYVAAGDTSIFKFVCRKCRFPVYNLDLS